MELFLLFIAGTVIPVNNITFRSIDDNRHKKAASMLAAFKNINSMPLPDAVQVFIIGELFFYIVQVSQNACINKVATHF